MAYQTMREIGRSHVILLFVFRKGAVALTRKEILSHKGWLSMKGWDVFTIEILRVIKDDIAAHLWL